MNLHLAAIGFDAVKKWVAVRLSDGSSDNTLYDTQADAARHHGNDRDRWCFIPVRPGGINVCQAESVMATNRRLYKAGFQLGDPSGRVPIPRLTRTDQARQLRALR
ncbi:MAG: hypothetical protein ACRDRD_00220 [Pseudonocardiaceae bacterium]